MGVDVKLLSSNSCYENVDSFSVQELGYISFPVVEAGGYSTLSEILNSCEYKVPQGVSSNPYLLEYDSYFIYRDKFESLNLPSVVRNQYLELIKEDNYNRYLILQPF